MSSTMRNWSRWQPMRPNSDDVAVVVALEVTEVEALVEALVVADDDAVLVAVLSAQPVSSPLFTLSMISLNSSACSRHVCTPLSTKMFPLASHPNCPSIRGIDMAATAAFIVMTSAAQWMLFVPESKANSAPVGVHTGVSNAVDGSHAVNTSSMRGSWVLQV